MRENAILMEMIPLVGGGDNISFQRIKDELFYQPSFSDFTLGGTYVINTPMHSMEPDYDARSALKQELSKAREGGCYLYVCHPGFLDHYILENTSLTLPRTDEADMLCDPEIRRWLAEQVFQLVTYDDLARGEP